jgi:hypothetical protein
MINLELQGIDKDNLKIQLQSMNDSLSEEMVRIVSDLLDAEKVENYEECAALKDEYERRRDYFALMLEIWNGNDNEYTKECVNDSFSFLYITIKADKEK